ncbi:hypothetical protein GCM10023115_21200 [Pontixanthobacter gangjinensis]
MLATLTIMIPAIIATAVPVPICLASAFAATPFPITAVAIVPPIARAVGVIDVEADSRIIKTIVPTIVARTVIGVVVRVVIGVCIGAAVTINPINRAAT